MNDTAYKVIGLGVGLGVLAYLVMPRDKSRVLLGTSKPETTWRGDPSSCSCKRKRPDGTTATGSTRFVVEDEPDWTLCVRDFSEADVQRCFASSTGAPLRTEPAFARTVAQKTTDAIESVTDKVRAVAASLFDWGGSTAAGGAVAGAFEAGDEDGTWSTTGVGG